MSHHHPTPAELIEATNEAYDRILEQACNAFDASASALEESKHAASTLTLAAKKHTTAAAANELIGRSETAHAHNTIAQRLTAAAEFIETGRLEIK